MLASRPGIFLHVFLLFGCLLFEIVLRQLLVFITHILTLTPLNEPSLFVLDLITPQVILDFPHMFEVEFVHSKFEIDNGLLVLAARTE